VQIVSGGVILEQHDTGGNSIVVEQMSAVVPRPDTIRFHQLCRSRADVVVKNQCVEVYFSCNTRRLGAIRSTLALIRVNRRYRDRRVFNTIGRYWRCHPVSILKAAGLVSRLRCRSQQNRLHELSTHHFFRRRLGAEVRDRSAPAGDHGHRRMRRAGPDGPIASAYPE